VSRPRTRRRRWPGAPARGPARGRPVRARSESARVASAAPAGAPRSHGPLRATRRAPRRAVGSRGHRDDPGVQRRATHVAHGSALERRAALDEPRGAGAPASVPSLACGEGVHDERRAPAQPRVESHHLEGRDRELGPHPDPSFHRVRQPGQPEAPQLLLPRPERLRRRRRAVEEEPVARPHERPLPRPHLARCGASGQCHTAASRRSGAPSARDGRDQRRLEDRPRREAVVRTAVARQDSCERPSTRRSRRAGGRLGAGAAISRSSSTAAPAERVVRARPDQPPEVALPRVAPVGLSEDARERLLGRGSSARDARCAISQSRALLA